jgi:hypothetical protein
MRSDNMLPSLSIQNLLNRKMRYAKFLGEHFHRHFAKFIRSSDEPHLFLSEFGSSDVLSSKDNFRMNLKRLASLSCHVLSIVNACACKQMIWIATRRIVALVANIKPFGDFSILQRPCNSVGVEKNLFCNPQLSISGSASCGGPLPAFVWISFFQPAPKPVLDFVRQKRKYFCSHIANFSRCVVSVFRWLQPSENATFYHGGAAAAI